MMDSFLLGGMQDYVEKPGESRVIDIGVKGQGLRLNRN
jgi:hypothetical protein